MGSAEAQGHRGLKVFRLAYQLAMKIFEATRSFPKDERYSLTDQIRRSSRSVAANIAEGCRKRQYPNMLSSKMADADAEATETVVWLDFAKDCSYLAEEAHADLISGYEEVGRMLGGILRNPRNLLPPDRK